jgi:hypothetical protein
MQYDLRLPRKKSRFAPKTGATKRKFRAGERTFMIELSRRHLLAGAAAIGAASAMPPLTAGAAVPTAAAQAPGFYRYKVGTIECTSINDGARTFPVPDSFVKNVPKEEVLAAAEAAYMPKGMVTIPFNPQLVNTGSKLVLIDCGNGIANFEPTKPTASVLPTVRWRFRTPKSWCRSRTGNSG